MILGWVPVATALFPHLGMHTKSLNANDDELVGIDHHLQEFSRDYTPVQGNLDISMYHLLIHNPYLMYTYSASFTDKTNGPSIQAHRQVTRKLVALINCCVQILV